MKESGIDMDTILLVGSNKLTYSIGRCLQKAGSTVVLVTCEPEGAEHYFALDVADDSGAPTAGAILIRSDYHFEEKVSMAIVITGEDLLVKKRRIAELENILSKDTLIAINSESISLSKLQQEAQQPHRILVANWVEPAHTTFFLEIIANTITRKSLADYLYQTAAGRWGKDPYVINGDTGIRMRLFAAMLREAFHLIKNGYANVEDIDRACRNDAGYYLPFAGNLRYMDLMGTYAYGMVMKDLNPELARDQDAPEYFQNMIRKGELGMKNGSGFYQYQPGEAEKWGALMTRFSHQIHNLIQKYPFNYNTSEADQDLNPVHSENRL